MIRGGYLLAAVIVTALFAVTAVVGAHYYVHARYDAGYEAGHAAAVAAGNAQRDLDAAIYLKKETDLRGQLVAKDVDAHRKEQEYATNLEAAQRRLRAGTDRLRCPAADPLQPATAPAAGPATAGAAADGAGPELVPEAAADLLGIAADAAGLVRRYQRVVERFEACRTVNAVP